MHSFNRIQYINQVHWNSNRIKPWAQIWIRIRKEKWWILHDSLINKKVSHYRVEETLLSAPVILFIILASSFSRIYYHWSWIGILCLYAHYIYISRWFYELVVLHTVLWNTLLRLGNTLNMLALLLVWTVWDLPCHHIWRCSTSAALMLTRVSRFGKSCSP